MTWCSALAWLGGYLTLLNLVPDNDGPVSSADTVLGVGQFMTLAYGVILMGCYTMLGFKRTATGLVEMLQEPGFVSSAMGGLLLLLTGAIPVLCVYAIISMAHLSIIAAVLVPLGVAAFIAYLRWVEISLFG